MVIDSPISASRPRKSLGLFGSGVPDNKNMLWAFWSHEMVRRMSGV